MILPANKYVGEHALLYEILKRVDEYMEADGDKDDLSHIQQVILNSKQDIRTTIMENVPDLSRYDSLLTSILDILHEPIHKETYYKEKETIIERPVEKVVYKDKIVEKPVEKVIYKDKIVTKTVEKPVEKIVYKEKRIEVPVVKTVYIDRNTNKTIKQTNERTIQIKGKEKLYDNRGRVITIDKKTGKRIVHRNISINRANCGCY